MMTNAGRTRSRGGELSVQALVAHRLDLRLSYGFTTPPSPNSAAETPTTQASGFPTHRAIRRLPWRSTRFPSAAAGSTESS